MPRPQPSRRRVRSVAQAEARLVEHLPLVRSLARHYASCSPESLDDLLQVGLLGLVIASRRYNSGCGKPFACFARPHVRGAILHHLRDQAWMVRLPRRQAERLQRQRLSGGSTGGPSNDEAMALQQWSGLNRALSLEWLHADGEEWCLNPVDPAAQPQQGAEAATDFMPQGLNAAWQHCSLDEMLKLVDGRQRAVLIDVVLKGWSYRRTAEALGVSAPTVQRAMHQGLQTLRQRLGQPPFSTVVNQRCHRGPSAAPEC